MDYNSRRMQASYAI